MEDFIPSWAVLNQRKIVWGSLLIAYGVYLLLQGDATVMRWIITLMSAVVFTIILSSGTMMLLSKLIGRERGKKQYQKVIIGCVLAYAYIISKTIGF